MLFYLSQKFLDWSAGTEWAERLSFLRLFRYITFRSAGAAITALLVAGAKSHQLAETDQVRPGVCGQGGGDGRTRRARAQ
jgi:hypothetical protein